MRPPTPAPDRDRHGVTVWEQPRFTTEMLSGEVALGVSEEESLPLIDTLERESEHPLASAVVAHVGQGLQRPLLAVPPD